MIFESPFQFIGLRLLLLIFCAKGTQQINRNPSNSSCGFHVQPNRLLLFMGIRSFILFQNVVKDEILMLISVAFYYSSQKNNMIAAELSVLK